MTSRFQLVVLLFVVCHLNVMLSNEHSHHSNSLHTQNDLDSNTAADGNQMDHSNLYYSPSCPVTSMFNFKVDGYFRYPLDLFEPQLLKKIYSKLHHHHGNHHSNHTSDSNNSNNDNDAYIQELKLKIYNCTNDAKEARTSHPRHVCSNFVRSKCPLHPINIDAALQRSSEWLYNTTITSTTNSTYLKGGKPQMISSSSSLSFLKTDLSNLKLPFLYRIWEKLSNPKETIRLIIYGGSGAAGADAMGCYCDPKLDIKCTVFNHSSYRAMHFGIDYECCWGGFFYRWLQSISAAKVHVIYWMRGGTDPNFAANTIPGEFADTPFTGNDILFLDYSMNEARKYFHINDVYTQEVNLERAIRAIFQTTSKIPGAGSPVVILTETWPYASGYDWGDPYITPRRVIDYTRAYTKIAQHYNLPIFSFKDMLWSHSLRTKQKHLQDTLRWKGSHPLFYHHLLFADLFVGIFKRELHRAFEFSTSIALALQQQQQQGYKIAATDNKSNNYNNQSNTSTSSSSGSRVINFPTTNHLDYINQLLNSSRQIQRYILPPQIITFQESVLCDETITPLLDLYATDFTDDPKVAHTKRNKEDIIGSYFTSHPATTPGTATYNNNNNNNNNNTSTTSFVEDVTMTTSSTESFKVYSDSKTKYGWIDEFPIATITDKSLNITTITTAIPIEKSKTISTYVPRTITFHFDDKNDDLAKYNHLVVVQFLGTYQNAGEFNVRICGQNYDVGFEIDALYSDWKFKKLSLTELYTPLLRPVYLSDKKGINQCIKELQDKKIINSQDMINNNNNNNNAGIATDEIKSITSLRSSTKRFLEFEHVPITECLDSKSNYYNQDTCKARTLKQKVKILAVKVCRIKGDGKITN